MKDMWAMAYHRILRAKDNSDEGKPGPCNCKECREYMASKGLDTKGQELQSVTDGSDPTV